METSTGDELVEAIIEATKLAWRRLRTEFADHALYGFALYTDGELVYILPTAFSDEGLAEVAAEYGDGATEEDLRFCGPDSPLHLVGEEFFDDIVQPLLPPVDYEDDDSCEAEISRRFEACFQALNTLRSEGLFDDVVDPARFVLNVLQGDQSDRSRMDNALRLNPPEAIAWLEQFLRLTSNDGTLAGEKIRPRSNVV